MDYLVDFDIKVPKGTPQTELKERIPTDPGNSGWQVQLGCAGAWHGASAPLKTWSKG